MTLFDWLLMLLIFKEWMHADIPSWVLWVMGICACITVLLKLTKSFLTWQLDKYKKGDGR